MYSFAGSGFDLPGPFSFLLPVPSGQARFASGAGYRPPSAPARAALRAVPILCLDEATAAMDPHTEQIVQETIKKVFDDRTTITIAHRLDTIIESDKVLVMEAGELKEYESPAKLLGDRSSMFSRLVDKTGVAAAAALRKMANEHFAQQAARRG